MTGQRSYWRWQLLLACFLIQAALFAQNKYYKLPASDKPLMLTWGLPPQPEVINWLREATNNAGFNEHRIAGCTIPESWHKRAKKHNARVEKQLDRTNPGWREKLRQEQDRLRQLFGKADSMVHQREIYQQAMEKWWDSVMVFSYFSEIKKDTLLLVRIADGNDLLTGNFRSYAQFELNMITGTLVPVIDITAKLPDEPASAASPNNQR
jgi:hypothetical protein